MTWKTAFQDAGGGLIVTAVTAVLGGVWWTIRKLFTNEKRIALLEAEMNAREKQRQEDRERAARIESGLETIRDHMMPRKE